jgi:uncharacterized membrane protein
MDSGKKTARILGVVFLLAFVTGILGIVLSGLISSSFTGSQKLLINVAENSMQMRVSILIDLIAAASVVALGTLLFESLKGYNRTIALLGLGLFFVEAVMLAVSRISVFSLLRLSNLYTKATPADHAYFKTLGSLLVGFSNSGYLILQFFFNLGGIMFYFLFYQSKLVPRFLAIWGLFAMTLSLTSCVLNILDQDAGMLFAIPNVLFEPFIGIWLIIKGFNSSPVTYKAVS